MITGMRALLTGSSGWLGRHLAPRLRAAGHAVIGVDVASGPDTQIVGSVADRAIVEAAFAQGAEPVIHAAALHKPDISRYPEQAFIDVNVTGTLNLLTAAATMKPLFHLAVVYLRGLGRREAAPWMAKW